MTFVMALIGLGLFAWIFVMGVEALAKRFKNQTPERFIYTSYVDSDGEQKPFVIDIKDIGISHD